MKRIIATSFVLAALTATSGCTRDRPGEPVNQEQLNPASVTDNDDTTSASPDGVATSGVNPNLGGGVGATPDTNDRGTVATDMNVSDTTAGAPSASDRVGESSSAPAREGQLPPNAKVPNAINTPGSHSPDMGAQSTNTATRTTPSASDSGNDM